MTRVLLTGGTGFVGACLTRRLLANGHEVHLLVRGQYQPWRLAGIENKVHLHKSEITDQESMRQLADSVKPQWVFHLAAHGAYSWQTDPVQIAQTNFMGTICLLEACLEAGCESFVHAGSSSEYGWKDHAPIENEWVDPNSAYAVTKAAATMYCRHMALTHNARVTTLRLYSVYGPYEEPNRFIPKLITHGMRGELPPLVNPDVARDFVYVEDVNDAFLAAAASQTIPPGAVYNIGTGKQTTIGAAVEAARALMGVATEPIWGNMTSRKWDTNTWVADISRAKKELGWTPRYSFEDGLWETLRWFRQAPGLKNLYPLDFREKTIGDM
jgi:UDP-glucose 4-epimerase